MNAKFLINLLFLAAFLLTKPQLLAQEKTRHMLPDDPASAWAEVQKVDQALQSAR
jgi:hypothetical protein